MNKKDEIFNKLQQFMKDFDIDCVETVYQCDSANEECVDLVAEFVEIMLK